VSCAGSITCIVTDDQEIDQGHAAGATFSRAYIRS
jgi:hypothetical protein